MLDYFINHLSNTYQVCCEYKRMDGIYAHARFVDLDLDARSQWVGKMLKISVECYNDRHFFFFLRDRNLDFAKEEILA